MVCAILDGRKTQTRRVVKPQPDGFWGSMQHAFAGGVLQCVVTKEGKPTDKYLACPYGVPGDRLWVRETWGYRGAKWDGAVPDIWQTQIALAADDSVRVIDLPDQTFSEWKCQRKRRQGESAEDYDDYLTRSFHDWRPSIFMPRWASRITLEITDVRVQRVQDISEGDAEAEGAEPCDSGLECSECPWIGFEDTPEVKRTDGEDWGFLCPNCSQLCAHHPIDEQYRFGVRHLWDSINAKRGFGWEANPWVWALTFRRVSQ
jgi:hypothetical protein